MTASANRIDNLLANYAEHVNVRWRPGVSAMERVMFCVYDRELERNLKLRLGDFEHATRNAQHAWAPFDLSDTYGFWLGQQEYRENYFKQPKLLSTVHKRYLLYLEEHFAAFAKTQPELDNTVIALIGVGSLFGILRIREVVETFAPHATGRLVVFFPGSYQDNNYRLLDQHDGWNYLAVPITSDKIY